MKTIAINLYKYDELSPFAQDKAIENYATGQPSDDWYQWTYDDAKNIGLKITSFDTDRQSIKGEFTDNAAQVAAAIIANHGDQTDTYKTAQEFLNASKAIEEKAAAEGTEGDEDYWYSEEIKELADDFLTSLLEDYLSMLRNEYDDLTSRKYAEEQIKENNYYFFADGVMAGTITYTGDHPKAGTTELLLFGKTYDITEDETEIEFNPEN